MTLGLQRVSTLLQICLGCAKPYCPDSRDRGWCKLCQYLFDFNELCKVRPQ